MTQEYYQIAMKFAGEKHCKQQVPGSKANYLLHVSNVTMEVLLAYQHQPDFNLDLAMQLAILHDTIEDTTATFEEIEANFSTQIAQGVLALTKNEDLPGKSERMQDSLNRINNLEKEVGLVKLADRITNLQEPPNHWNQAKINKYHQEAQLIANSLSDKNAYLYQRILEKIERYKQFVISPE